MKNDCLSRRFTTSGLCLLLVLLSSCGESLLDPTPSPRTVGQAIVNGTAEPQVVELSQGEKLAIGWLHLSHSSASNFCTGTLIAPNVVVTARHCTEYYRASEIGFAVGSSPTSAAATFDVAEIRQHSWEDIALLVLDQDATAALPQLEVIAANTEEPVSADVGRPLDAVGYGETYGSNPAGRWFARVYLTEVASSTIVVDGRGEQGICYGDSGGPVLWERPGGGVVVVAVESGGEDSCVGRDVMTRLDPLFGDFIEPVVGVQVANDPCNGLDYLGRCNGAVVEWCDGGQLRSVDCAAHSTSCGWVDQDTGYFCVETTTTDDPGTEDPTLDPQPPSEPSPVPEDPVTDEPPAEDPSEPIPTDPPSEQDGGLPDGPQAIGCAQAGGTGPSPGFMAIGLLALVGLIRRR